MSVSPLEAALRDRAVKARAKAQKADDDEDVMQAVALRGKARGFDESADLVNRLWGRQGVRS